MPVFSLFNFDDTSTDAADSAPENGIQAGYYVNGATSVDGQAVLDGTNDLIKIFPDQTFQSNTGTLEISFTLGQSPLTVPQTVLSRDSTGDTQGGFRVEILPNGAVQISHETGQGVEVTTTAPGFAAPGDQINLTYSWDQGGDGGAMTLSNMTSAETFEAPVSDQVTMDMGSINQAYIIGGGQTTSTPGLMDQIDQHFEGSIDMFSLSDTVDNLPNPDGIVSGTSGDDLINIGYIGDADGDRIDANDALLAGDAPQDDRVLAGDGNDTVLANQGDDSVEGGDGDDSLVGSVGNDSLYGQDGNDTLIGGNDGDLLDGGNGNDLAQGGASGDVITTSGSDAPLPDIDYPGLWSADANLNNDLDTVYGGAGDDTISTGDDADYIDGGTGNDVIDGGIDADTILGNQGNDVIVGAEGADLIDAGQGDDLVYGGYGPDVPEAVNIADDAGDLRPNNANDDIRGGMGNDTIYGQDDDDTIDGGQNDDFIDGGVDDDLITGNTGADTITGGQGNDTLSGGNDRDLFLSGNGGDVVDGNEGGDDFDTLDLSGAGPLNIIYDPNNAENGTVQFLDADRNVTGTMSFVNIENVIPCFTPGTMIATPRGEVPVESLRPGDKVVTRDNGLQEIRWIGSKAMSWADLSAAPHMKPVLIAQGSLGNGLPERDMMVSPNHRLLVANDRTALYFDEHEVLVAAKHLAGSRGMHSVDAAGVTYVHIMFDRHEVVLSNGAWTESFQPGDYTLKGMGNAQRSEIFELFPDLQTAEGLVNYEAARRTLKRHEAKLLIR